MSKIDETLAKRNKENYSFFDYKAGSATAEYNAVIADATAKIEAAKARVSEEGKVRLDNLLEWYKSAYANWINKHNANGAGHVSWAIAGPSNYNMKQHEKFMSREGKLWAEYDDIKDIEPKIHSIVRGDKIIKTGDPSALDKLKEKLAKAQEEHQGYKDYNVKARKEGTQKLPAYVLANSNGRMKTIKDRIAQLERLASQETKEIAPTAEIEGVKIVDNTEANRLQIVFDYKPDLSLRTILKKHGFRYSYNNNAWQRYRSPEATRIAQEIVSNIK